MAKRVGGRGSALDPAGGAYDAPPDPLVGWGGDTPSALDTRRSQFFPLLLIYEMTTDIWRIFSVYYINNIYFF